LKLPKFSYGAQLNVLLAPYLVGALLLVGAPALLTFLLAFTFYDGLSAPIWRGWHNFTVLFADPRLPQVFYNTFYFVILAVPLRVCGALLFALLLNDKRRGIGFYRAAIYLPTVLPDVAYALLWLWIFNPLYGPLNLLLHGVGLPMPPWLVTGDTARLALVIMSFFQLGEGFVILLAGRQSIPKAYYEAARLDGANAWQLFRYITFPLLRPWLLLLTLRDVAMSFQSTFTAAYLMTGGGPYYATLVLPLFAYDEAFEGFRLGESSALLLMAFLIAAALIAILFLFWREE
jgi:multiple sugar transport system permease protein